MIVFRYDKSFEGLLTAVFDAYARREFPDRLVGEGAALPLFAGDPHAVVTDPGKSARVWAGVERRLPRHVCNMVTYAWLSERPGCDDLIFRFLRGAFDAGEQYSVNFADKDALELRQLALKVSREGCFVREFIRFQKGGDGTFLGLTAPEYNALPLAINHFLDRFADQKWLVYDTRRHYGYYYDLHRVTEITLDDDAHLLDGHPGDDLLAEDEKYFQELWKTYFRSVAIKERKNPRLQRQMMPRRFWKYLTEKQ